MRPALGCLRLALLAAHAALSHGVITVKYFAYGSNLAASVREGRRRLSPMSSAPGFVRDHRLAFNVPGFALAEPAFASIQRAEGEECHGGVYELSVGDWLRLCASEGVPFGYRVVEVPVELYAGVTVPAYTLEAGLPDFMGDLTPSERYLTLIREGARELGLTPQWQERLAKVPVAPLGTRAQLSGEDFEKRSGSTFV